MQVHPRKKIFGHSPDVWNCLQSHPQTQMVESVPLGIGLRNLPTILMPTGCQTVENMFRDTGSSSLVCSLGLTDTATLSYMAYKIESQGRTIRSLRLLTSRRRSSHKASTFKGNKMSKTVQSSIIEQEDSTGNKLVKHWRRSMRKEKKGALTGHLT